MEHHSTAYRVTRELVRGVFVLALLTLPILTAGTLGNLLAGAIAK
ncbi:hypothetical protein SEA_WALTZ_89 [Arthrobacter phage Waltz]|nr:hypothetical protein SEA_WALTZ_89 [Arthrobacter phage Waltz]